MKNLLFCILLVLSSNYAFSQSDEIIIHNIYNEQLTNSLIHENLRYLTKEIGNRINGSSQLASAIAYTQQLMTQNQFDTVYLQPVMVPNWIRGKKEVVKIIKSSSKGNLELNSLALGNSIGTGDQGLSAEVIEINGLDELKKIDENAVRRKIVFLNQPLDRSLINMWDAYHNASDQRNYGASQASIKGAKAVIVRSLAIGNDDSPHTGYVGYDEGVIKIPAVAISTNDANLLSDLLKEEPNTVIYLNLDCQTKENVLSHNVIGEIKGSEFPNEIIVIGGHLDSWDIGEGAHDDGGGCLQAIEVLRSFKVLGIQPKRTLRVVLWVDEENNWNGNAMYAEKSKESKENNIAAFESDRGVFMPFGFYIDTDNEIALQRIRTWKSYFESYKIFQFREGKGNAGEDITPLKNTSIVLFGLMPDSQRYFTLHHSEKDVFEAVDKRELELGAAAMTAMVYLMDKYGIN